MSEPRPLASTLPQPQVTSCPLFNDSASTAVRSWSASAFGLSVVALSFVEAIYRLGVRAFLSMHKGLSFTQWSMLVVSVLAFAYGEGYRALHRRFIPHVIARASELARISRPGLRSWFLAPCYVLCLAQAQGAALRRAWLSVVLIGAAVVIVRALPEPYRGIIDAGVAVALSIGLASLALRVAAAIRAGHGQHRQAASSDSV